MSKNIFIIIAIIGGIIIGASGSHFLSKSKNTSGSADPSTTAIKEERKILYYQAPMDPTYIRFEPGRSPMGMELVPVYEGASQGVEGLISIDPVIIQNIGVKSQLVKRVSLTRDITTIGRIDYNEKKVVEVHSKVSGWVEKLFVDFTGKKIKQDDMLLEIYSPTLISAQEEYLLAKKHEGNIKGIGSENLSELSKKRLELWDVPAHQIKELEEKGTVIRKLHIHSPASGVVVKKHVTEGMYIKPGMSLYTIADLSKVWVYADIYEYEIALVKVGQVAEMTLEAYPGEVFEGQVTFIYPFLEDKSRTNKVRLEFKNPKGKLKPEMYASISIKSTTAEKTLAVPTEAVIRSGEREVVILDIGEGKFLARPITLGREAGGYFEVKKGLEENDRVVTSAQFLIDSESRLKEAISKMLKEKKSEEKKNKTKAKNKATTHDMGEMNHDMSGMVHDDMPMKTEDKTTNHDMGEMNHEGMQH
ncbi:MAG: efflux RND transporter periplasmic adaptor subunit [Deltaproteobacteria bacterium]|nr:efflux RND transporter periplasmic adaptor subunit [Deltaproteobacteria bacterium]